MAFLILEMFCGIGGLFFLSDFCFHIVFSADEHITSGDHSEEDISCFNEAIKK